MTASQVATDCARPDVCVGRLKLIDNDAVEGQHWDYCDLVFEHAFCDSAEMTWCWKQYTPDDTYHGFNGGYSWDFVGNGIGWQGCDGSVTMNESDYASQACVINPGPAYDIENGASTECNPPGHNCGGGNIHDDWDCSGDSYPLHYQLSATTNVPGVSNTWLHSNNPIFYWEETGNWFCKCGGTAQFGDGSDATDHCTIKRYQCPCEDNIVCDFSDCTTLPDACGVCGGDGSSCVEQPCNAACNPITHPDPCGGKCRCFDLGNGQGVCKDWRINGHKWTK
ncbi:MAG: hypothetical protein QGI45_05455 [Myxococcota bacterium]|nr:hypothetical protein [Myxococcota bacterium]